MEPIGSDFHLVFSNKTRKLSYRKDDRAMRPMYGRPENFQESLTTHTATFPEILMGFCSD